MVAISVIIPVYNTEEYIKECIETLLSQTLPSCEFIFVNDGSKDNCQQIIESYQATDSRIVLLNQENKGVSAARNAGIAIAKGKYIGFVDADDFVETKMFEKLYLVANQYNANIVASNFISQQDGIIVKSKSVFLTDKIYDKKDINQEVIPFCIKEDGLNSACNKVYKSELILTNAIDFPVGVKNGEDALFNLKAFNKAESIVFTDYAGYHYREVEGSASRNIVGKNYFERALEVYQFDYKSELNLSLDEMTIEELKSIRLVNTVVSLVHIYFKSKQESFRNRCKYVKSMINNVVLQKALRQNWEALLVNKNRYQQFILKSIRAKSILRLVLATRYSNYRNKR